MLFNTLSLGGGGGGGGEGTIHTKNKKKRIYNKIILVQNLIQDILVTLFLE